MELLFFFLLFCSSNPSHNVKADWFSKARYGILVHYLNNLQVRGMPWSQGKRTSWDDCVNSFDVQNIASVGEIYHIRSVPKSRFIRGVQGHAATFIGKGLAIPGFKIFRQ